MNRAVTLVLFAGTAAALPLPAAHAQHTFAWFYSGPPQSIPDGFAGCTSPCNFSVAATDVNVNMFAFPITWVEAEYVINHPYQGDLNILLYRADSNTSAVLVDRPGSTGLFPCGFSAANYGVDLNNPFRSSDAAGGTYDTPGVSFPGIGSVTGTWRSEQALTTFQGWDTGGIWRLVVSDCAAGDTGTINGFVLITNSPWGEFEPNETKAQASNIGYYPLVDGEPVTGYTRGSDPAAGIIFSYDTMMAGPETPHPPGLYRHRLDISARARGVPTNDYTGTLLGLTQSGGVIQPGSEGVIGVAQAPIDQPRFVQWYQVGTPSIVFFRMSGSLNTGASYYAAAMQTDPVPIGDAGSFAPGNLTITTVGQTAADTDVWVLDAAFNPIPGYGNDDSAGTVQSTLTRSFAAGTYYLAISDYNLAPSLASPPDDQYRSGNVMDYDANLACGSAATGVNLTFRITDSLGQSVVTPATKAGPFDVLFYRITVATPCYANCDRSTGAPALTVADFGCFLNAYAAGSAYANCDHSTAAPVLTVADFGCFLNAYAAGCS